MATGRGRTLAYFWSRVESSSTSSSSSTTHGATSVSEPELSSSMEASGVVAADASLVENPHDTSASEESDTGDQYEFGAEQGAASKKKASETPF